MKRMLIITVCLFIGINTIFSQIQDLKTYTPNYKETIGKSYEGGEDGFLNHFYMTVKYPAAARSKCRVGQLLVQLTISPSGELGKIIFLNHLGEDIEEAVEDVLKMTKGRWIASSTGYVINFSVAFQIEDEPDIKGDIKVIAYGAGGTSGGGCGSNADLESKLDKAIEKNKRKLAIDLCEELLRRNPFSEEYRKKLADLDK